MVNKRPLTKILTNEKRAAVCFKLIRKDGCWVDEAECPQVDGNWCWVTALDINYTILHMFGIFVR